MNSEINHINTRQQINLHQPSSNTTKYQKGVYYLGILYITTEIENPKKFKRVSQNFLHDNSLYSLEEFLHHKKG
jgi:hypothetical protein